MWCALKKIVEGTLVGIGVVATVMALAFVVTALSEPGMPEELVTGGNFHFSGGDHYIEITWLGLRAIVNLTKGLLASVMLACGIAVGMLVGYRQWGRDDYTTDER